MRVRLRAIFSGRVQGVFFRAHAQRFALEHMVDGWIRNLEDGRVQGLFEGEEEAVRTVLQECQHSQPYARVDSVEVIEEEPRGDVRGFRIRY